MIGKVLADRYQISELIGKGGMAMVYRAVDLRTGHSVAIKILRPEFSEDAEFLSRFQREAEAASKMSHHNIVNLLDVGMDGDNRYLVMEYVQGKTLKEVIREKGKMSPQVAGQIAVRILAALQHAHRNGIIHRDIKPQNILVHADGHIKVADFGIARMANSSTLTKGDNVMGSVHYFSPEQASGEQAGETSDIYSVGVVLYEMLTGKVPFDGDSPVAVAMQHLHAQPTPVRELSPEVPEPVSRVVETAMEKEPKKRYQSALEMASDLRHALDGREEQMKAQRKRRQDSGEGPEAAGADGAGEAKGIKQAAGKAFDSARQQKQPASRQDSSRQNVRADRGDTSRRGKAVSKGKKPRLFRPRGSYASRRRLTRQIVKWGATALMAVLVFYGLYLGGVTIYQRVVNTVAAPDLVGMDEETAVRQSQRSGLNTEIIRSAHPSVASGIVIMQTPEFETSMRKGDTIVLTVSKGPSLQTAPQVTGLFIQEAVEQLQLQGLVLSVAEKVVSDEPMDTILTQKPEAGIACVPGDTIQVTVSGGSVTVPDIEGIDQQDAADALVQSGLTLDAIEYLNTQDPELDGLVAGQQPSMGGQVIWGTKATITVYRLVTGYAAQVRLELKEPERETQVSVTLVGKDGSEAEQYTGVLAPGGDLHPEIEVRGDTEGPAVYRVYLDGELAYEAEAFLE